MRFLIVAILFSGSVAVAAPRHVVFQGGTPYERGLSHGRALRADILELVGRWSNGIQSDFGITAAEFTRRFLERTAYVEAVRRWTPHLAEEVRGIADGAGVPYETMLVYQFGDEMWTEGDDLAKHCTSIGVDRRGGEPTYVAQNMDIEEFYAGFVVIAEIHGDGLDQLVLTYPGHIGLNGVNRAGIAVACNTIQHLSGSREGLPQAFVVRGILEQPTFADAEAFLRSIRHASGQNYLIGDSEHAVNFEVSASKVIAVPPQLTGCVYHTNYPLANDDYRKEYLSGKKPPYEGRGRYAAVARRMQRKQTVKTIKDALRSRDDRTSAVSNDATFASTIFVLKRPVPELLVAPGRPDLNDYTKITFGGPVRRSSLRGTSARDARVP
jgi:isopenicillin-N N-acyltransferase-like protein